MIKYKINIGGMHCASCASNVERSLKKILEIKEVNVSIIGKKAFVEANKPIPKEELVKAVSRAGYKVINIE